MASNLSIFFDIGGVVGGIGSGAVSDFTGCSSLVSFTLCMLSAPTVYVYYSTGMSNFIKHIARKNPLSSQLRSCVKEVEGVLPGSQNEIVVFRSFDKTTY